MNKLTAVKPLPFINAEVVKKGVTAAYVLEKSQNDGFNGTVSDVKAEEVTLTGFRRGAAATLKFSAAQLKANEFAVFKYAQDMTGTSDGSKEWTKDVNTEMIDPDVCGAGYFIMYRKCTDEEYTNGLIVNVEREKMTVLTVQNGKNVVVTLTMAEMKKAGFAAEVSPWMVDGSDGQNIAVIKNAQVSDREITNTENLWFNT